MVKTLSDTRTILSAGDLLREDASVQASPDKEQTAEQKAVPTGISNGCSGDSIKTVTENEPTTKKHDKSYEGDEFGIKELISKVEKYVIWSQSINPLDEEQVKYLIKLKKLISHFTSVSGLLKACVDFVDREEGTLYPSTITFLLLIYFSDAPERYIPMFLTKPLYYTIDPQTHARKYEFDAFVTYLEKRIKKGHKNH